MMITPHVLVGAALAVKISNPFALVFAAVASHFIIDMIPHKDYEIAPLARNFYKLLLDGLIAAAALWYVVASLPLERQALIALGGFFAILPDGLWMLYRMFGWKLLDSYVRFHHYAHWLIIPETHKTHYAFGLATQALVITLSLYVLSPLFL